MSSTGGCTDPSGCDDALQRMVFFIDNELPNADAATIRAHLEECAPCVGEFDIERTVKALVARCCSETAPADLRAKVVARIRTVNN